LEDLVIGGYNTLEATGENRDGLLLASPRGDVLLPTTQVGTHRIGEMIKVFIHNNSEHGLVASTLEPRAMLGDIACLTVTDSNNFGAFLDWGLPKDLLCPKSQQQRALYKGDTAVVKVCFDPENDRIFASSRLRDFFEEPGDELKRGQEIDIIGLWHSDLGFNVLIEGRFGGLIHRKEMLDYLETGYRGRAWVKEVRHDGGVSVSLKPKGFSGVVEANDRVLNALEKCGGRLPFDDNSDPELIQQRMKMSKKTFKKAIGNLMRLGLVKLEKHGITRTDKPRRVESDEDKRPYQRRGNARTNRPNGDRGRRSPSGSDRRYEQKERTGRSEYKGSKSYSPKTSTDEDRSSSYKPRYSEDRPPKKSPYKERDQRETSENREDFNPRTSKPRYSEDRPPKKSPYKERDQRETSGNREDFNPRTSKPRYSEDRPPKRSPYKERDQRETSGNREDFNPRTSKPRYNEDRPTKKSPYKERDQRETSGNREDFKPRTSKPRYNEDRPPKKSPYKERVQQETSEKKEDSNRAPSTDQHSEKRSPKNNPNKKATQRKASGKAPSPQPTSTKKAHRKGSKPDRNAESTES